MKCLDYGLQFPGSPYCFIFGEVVGYVGMIVFLFVGKFNTSQRDAADVQHFTDVDFMLTVPRIIRLLM